MTKQKRSEKPTVARNIISRRKALGITSAMQLSRETDIPYPTIRDIEAGISGGRKETLEKIAETLGCTLSDLYADEKPNPAEFNHAVKIIESVLEATKPKQDRLSHLPDDIIDLLEVFPLEKIGFLRNALLRPAANAAKKKKKVE